LVEQLICINVQLFLFFRKLMNSSSIKKSIQIGLFSVASYLVVTSVVMFFYNGGDRFDPARSSYNFFGSFLSDLGRMHEFSGLTSYTTGTVYALALGFMGIGAILFFLAHYYLVPGAKNILKWPASIIGLIAGVSDIGIACTPWDIYPKAHLVFVFTRFISFSVTCMCMFLIVIGHSTYPNTFGFVYLFLCILNISYILFMTLGPDSEDPWGRIVQATGQKIVIYTQSMLIIYCAYGALRVAAKIREENNPNNLQSSE